MLVQRYDDFELPQALRSYPAGTFNEFVAYRKQRSASLAETTDRHVTLTKAWRQTYLVTKPRNALLLASLAVAQVLLAGGA